MEGQQVPVSWSSVAAANTYVLERKSSAADWTQVYSGADTQFTDTPEGGWTSVQYLSLIHILNAPVIIESIDQGERDGTNDLYITIRMKQYRKPEVPVLAVSGGGAQTSRDDGTGAAQERTYTIQSGDTLWGIAKKYYGSGTEYKRLAEANRDQIPNPNLIYPGQTIVLSLIHL